jgi:hypothetical protein
VLTKTNYYKNWSKEYLKEITSYGKWYTLNLIHYKKL